MLEEKLLFTVSVRETPPTSCSYTVRTHLPFLKQRNPMRRDLRRGIHLSFILAVAFSSSAGSTTGGANAREAAQYEHQPPEQVMDSIGIEPGMVIAEVGAGRGRYVVPVARRVGPEGKVYANDIDEDRLEDLESRCERDSIPNVTTILGEIEDPLLPARTMDLVYMINTYHHLERPVELMENIVPCLKPGGRLAIIEHDPIKVPSMGSHATAKEIVIDQAEKAGFKLERMLTFLSRDNIYIFSYRE